MERNAVESVKANILKAQGINTHSMHLDQHQGGWTEEDVIHPFIRVVAPISFFQKIQQRHTYKTLP